MTRAPARTTARTLFAVLGAPAAWALHLSIVYLTIVVACRTSWQGTDWAIPLQTAVFAAVALAAGVIAWRERREASEDDATHRFLHTVGLVGSPVFAAAIVLAGVAPAVVTACG